MNHIISLDNWTGNTNENNSVNVELQGVSWFHGQKVLVSNNTVFININEPFYSAGKKYRWKLQNTVGIGLSQELVNYAYVNGLALGVIVGTTNDRYYQCSPAEVQKFVMRTGSTDHRGCVQLLVYPWTLCRTVRCDMTAIIEILKG